MSKVSVLDASAVLAYLQQERGQERVEEALDQGPCWISAVNLCEVLGKLCERGMPPEEAQDSINDLGLIVQNFDVDAAAATALLRVRTKSIGVSLGDRACLALAERAVQAQDSPTTLTAEQSWAKLKWPFKIVAVR